MKKMTGFLSILSLILTLAACAPSRKVVTVEVTDSGLKARQAASLVEKGHYLAFKRAVLIYGELYGNRAMRQKIAALYLEASLLLALREKEIGLDNPATIAAAEKDFLESLKYNPANSESLFGVGTVAGRKNRWEESGSYYEKAGRALIR